MRYRPAFSFIRQGPEYVETRLEFGVERKSRNKHGVWLWWPVWTVRLSFKKTPRLEKFR